MKNCGLIIFGVLVHCLGCSFDTDGGPVLIDAGEPGLSDAGTTGLGETCYADDDCVEYVADVCAVDPNQPDEPGYCTINDCIESDCTNGFACCDCSAVSMIGTVFCARADQVDLLISDMVGCTLVTDK